MGVTMRFYETFVLKRETQSIGRNDDFYIGIYYTIRPTGWTDDAKMIEGGGDACIRAKLWMK